MMSECKSPGHCCNLSVVEFLIWLFVFFVLLSPSVNGLAGEIGWLSVYFYSIMASIVVLAYCLIKQDNYLSIILAVFLLLAASYSQGFVKAAGYALTFYLSYVGITKYRATFIYCIFGFAVLSYFVMLGQLSGHFNALFGWVNYSNVADPVPVFSVDSVPASYLPQMRPSGLFPTTTYMSVFCILLFSVALFQKKSTTKYVLVFIGSFLAVTGATIGLVMVVILAVLLLPRLKMAVWLVSGYSFTIAIYFIVLPELAAYNYSLNDFEISVMNRVMDESILTLNPELLLFMVLISSMVIIIKLYNVSGCISLVAPLSLAFGPILLHSIVSSLMYSMLLGAAVGMLGELLKWPKFVLHPFELVRPRKGSLSHSNMIAIRRHE